MNTPSITIKTLGRQDTMIAATLVLDSSISARGGTEDVRLSSWLAGTSQWAVAIIAGTIAGVAVLNERDQASVKLIWLETREGFKARGVGSALLFWARATAQTQGKAMFVSSAEEAVGFYAKVIPGSMDNGHEFLVAA
ncbi:MAG: GNAT family N-acetyltransferase [Chloroflexales bacterium]|nr:GNAT family N-acetyltransferase [Chloroflexales bacterium]